jgi:hypothetical protein
MLRKKEVYTVCTPIPGFIPRQLALDILHSHSEVITLNPLVIDHRPISAPRDAVADEFYSTWYEITERVQVVPGMGKVGSSKITFNGCFHDMPWGLQTHTYAPFNIDIRIKYRVAGNQPGEPPEAREIGLQSIGAPQSGLYLREDIEIKCNISLVSFVKAQLKAASKEMVSRIIRKAELLDSGVLQAMMSPDGKLKTVNPNDRSQVASDNRPLSPNAPMRYSPSSPQPPVSYPNPSASPCLSPAMSHGRSNTATSWQDYNQRNSYHTAYPNQQQQQQYYHQQMTPPPIPPKEQVPSPQPMELPGDFQYHGPPQPSPSLHPSQMGFAPHHMPPPGYEGVQASPTVTDPYRTSTGSAYGSSAGQPSPGFFSQQSYAAELPSSNDNRQGWKQ